MIGDNNACGHFGELTPYVFHSFACGVYLRIRGFVLHVR
ncbi:unannotated protein [freshwater metagenome]|uniref:Unannotated protein n=1 Tax=freshwater metagenome TaxID=449393 RepID=A0A6J6WW17_9ZZZZ